MSRRVAIRQGGGFERKDMTIPREHKMNFILADKPKRVRVKALPAFFEPPHYRAA
jgi:hypothetical protein